MALTNHERVGKALDLLRAGLGPYAEREIHSAVNARRVGPEAPRVFTDDPNLGSRKISEWDAAGLLKLMWETWNQVFRESLGPAERSFVGELRNLRNRWAHQESFSSDDAYRALDTVGRLLTSVSASEAADVEKIKMELLRVRFDEQARTERRRQSSLAIGGAIGRLKPWREVAVPHQDVSSGQYHQAEFAADLWQVHIGEASSEYRDPAEFFHRTYLTESLKKMLIGAIQRLSGSGGDPVVHLQTNFGGGKTHSMLALYHLFSGAAPRELAGVESLMEEVGAKALPSARRVVLVGTKISPGNPDTKHDGTVVRTMWGELAWQLGGRPGFERIADDDKCATSPGDALRHLLIEYGPAVILIDEWVAYARQLHDNSDLPGGSFETQFTFAQALTEAAKAAGNSLLVISLPVSDTNIDSSRTRADDVEVGGRRGREALERLRNVVGRIESSWRPASAEEGFEIVRRRLFEPFTDPHQFKSRDVVAREFANLYRTQHQEFPIEVRDGDYEKRIVAAYPIHPEVFDRLYTDWSALASFQRTRGVLRLMAAVIHSLWERGDTNPLILPAHLAIDDQRVQWELTRYLPDTWTPVIEKDVDGPQSLPLRIDAEVPNLGKLSACRRVARAIYLGSAPSAGSSHRGVEDRRIKLGSVLPGESPSVFGDALRRMAARATYLYQDGPRYWYDTRATVTKLAEDKAAQLEQDPDRVRQAIKGVLDEDLRQTGGFERIHTAPSSEHDVPDRRDTRLVVLGTDHPHQKGAESSAVKAASSLLESRGNAPRIFRNTLVFLAPDQTRLQDLNDAIRRHLAWEEIVTDKESLDLSPHQVKQAETQRKAAADTVKARLPETYRWLLVPAQTNPDDSVSWTSTQLRGQDPLAVQAAERLARDEWLVKSLAGSSLQRELNKIPLWRGDHVSIRQLVDDFASYLYLPRLTGPNVLLEAVSDGIALLTWADDSFGYADSFDESSNRYRGLLGGRGVALTDENSASLVVKGDKAQQQIRVESKPPEIPTGEDGTGGGVISDPPAPIGDPPSPQKPIRFHGSVGLDSTRPGRDASTIADEVISHLSGIVGAKVTVTLEIEAIVPDGVPENVVRTVTENSRTLKFESHGFERD